MKEGKKGVSDQYKDKLVNKDYRLCDECVGELVKLETILGEAYSESKEWYRDFYWVCICSKCNRIVKVLENKVKSNNWVVGKGRYRDRSNVSGR